jgi:hypothetical protein
VGANAQEEVLSIDALHDAVDEQADGSRTIFN